MIPVTYVAKNCKQPKGGFIKPSSLDIIQLDDGKVLSENENVNASNIGMTVDYLTRYLLGEDIKTAFNPSLSGALNESKIEDSNIIDSAFASVESIDKNFKKTGKLEWFDIASACQLTAFDVWLRNPSYAKRKLVSSTSIRPNRETIENIRIMVDRGVSLFDTYGPITASGFDFEGAYTESITSGDGDYLTKNTLWDFKVSKSKPTSKHTFQILIYWIMGQHTGKEEFKNIDKIAIFNPRLNCIYYKKISDIPEETIRTIEEDAIGY